MRGLSYNCGQSPTAMPLYEYQCDACGARFELIRKFSDPPLDGLPDLRHGAGSETRSRRRRSSSRAPGWYVTDYARKSGDGDSKGGDSKRRRVESGREVGRQVGRPRPGRAPSPKPKDAARLGRGSQGIGAASDKPRRDACVSRRRTPSVIDPTLVRERPQDVEARLRARGHRSVRRSGGAGGRSRPSAGG